MIKVMVILLLGVISGGAFAASDNTQFSIDNPTTTLKTSDKGRTVLISISTSPAKESEHSTDHPKFSGLVITSIKINVEGKDILIPKSAVDYLVDVNRCSIKRDKNGWALSIDGRDGAYGYVAVIYFNRDRVQRRAMFADANRSHMTEEIKYMPPEVIN
jgi:hypothetical protein